MKEELTKEQIEQVVACLKDLRIHVGNSLNGTAEIIKEIFAENLELRDQLAKYQSPDYQSLDDLAVALSGKFPTPPFYDGERVRLKKRREITGIVERVSITWLTGKPTVVCVVNTSLSPSLMTFAASELESLPEADDPKQ
ncbi:hypothetical protein AA471_11135 [Salmonella enterica subsp. enterica]|nr:hypothetical protein [Salmonella enterica subsp. enterica]EDQ2988618.1 hypothetical protein [Salmonella enterica subsp. enterica]